MKKDNYRKILSEKFKAANQLETGPMTEEDEEYLRILAEARTNHAKIKAARQEARKRLAARAAAVLIIAALVSSSYLLGMKSDTKASADNDDEVKVVQQGDNIIIGPGVSEKDENVGVVTKTYYSLEDMPEEVLEKVSLITLEEFRIDRIKVYKAGTYVQVNINYKTAEGIVLNINQRIYDISGNKSLRILNVEKEWMYKDCYIYKVESNQGESYRVLADNWLYDIDTSESLEQKKIEDILDDLIN